MCYKSKTYLNRGGLGIIFDMDGVIINTCRLHEMAWKEAARIYKLLWKNEIDFKRDVFGTVSSDSARILFDPFLKDYDISQMCKKKDEIYQSLLDQNVKDIVVSGFKPFFESIVEKGIPVALATSSPSNEANLVLRNLGIYEYFDAVIDVSKVQNPKPDPEVYLKACHALGLSPEQCIGFEDSITGIRALDSADVKCIVVGSTLEYERLIHSGVRYELYIPDFTHITLDKLYSRLEALHSYS